MTLSGYTTDQRLNILVNPTRPASGLSDFPLLVKFADNADIGADIDSNGYNIAFTLDDGDTELDYEREYFLLDSGEATGVFWVSVPSISSSVDTNIFIYFKAASPSDRANPTAVWTTANYENVYHLNDDPSGGAGCIIDSAGTYNGTPVGSMTSGDLVDAHIHKGLELDGSDDAIALSLTSSADFPGDLYSGSRTLTATFKTYGVDTGEFQMAVVIADDASAGASTGWAQANNIGDDSGLINYAAGVVTRVPSTVGYSSPAIHIDANTFYHAHSVFDNSNQTIEAFANGVSTGTPTATGSSPRVANFVASGRSWIGQLYPYTSQWYGIIDEVRIDRVVRSAAWIEFEAHNIMDVGNNIEIEEPGGGAITVEIGIVSETDSQFSITSSKVKAVGLDTEADTTLDPSNQKARAVGLNTETDSQFSPSHIKQKAVGLNTETDSQFSPTCQKARAVGINSETDSQFALTAKKSVTLGLNTESDSVFGLGIRIIVSVGIVSETDSQFSLSSQKTKAVGLNTETDSLLSPTHAKAIAVGLNTETDSLFSPTHAKALAIGINSETDSQFSITHRKIVGTGLCTESDFALNLGTTITVQIGPVSETDSLFSVSKSKLKAVAFASETDSAIITSTKKQVHLGLPIETDTALAFSTGGAGSASVYYQMVLGSF